MVRQKVHQDIQGGRAFHFVAVKTGYSYSNVDSKGWTKNLFRLMANGFLKQSNLVPMKLI